MRECGLKFGKSIRSILIRMVTPLAGVWVEIFRWSLFRISGKGGSLPLRECGLKYSPFLQMGYNCQSLPLRECGLKYLPTPKEAAGCAVTPLAGVWVEISLGKLLPPWIQSLPLRECGLKSSFGCRFLYRIQVTPLAGVWVEIKIMSFKNSSSAVTPLAGVWVEMPVSRILFSEGHRHSPCGSVG